MESELKPCTDEAYNARRLRHVTDEQLMEVYAKQSQIMQWLIYHDEGDTARMAGVISRMQDIRYEWGSRGHNVRTL